MSEDQRLKIVPYQSAERIRKPVNAGLRCCVCVTARLPLIGNPPHWPDLPYNRRSVSQGLNARPPELVHTNFFLLQ